MGLAAAVVTALGLTTGALADVVPLQGDPFAPDPALADVWAAGAEESDPFANLLSVDAADEGQAPLLELLGMPTQVRRNKVNAYAVASAEPRASAGERDTTRLAAPATLDDSEDSVAALGRKALEVFEGLGVTGGPSESYGMRQPTIAEPMAAQPQQAPSEGQSSSWLREAMQILRGNREWVVLGVLTLLAGTIAFRHFGQSSGASKPAGRRPVRMAR